MGQLEFRVLGLTEREGNAMSQKEPERSRPKPRNHAAHASFGGARGAVLWATVAVGAVAITHPTPPTSIVTEGPTPACVGKARTTFDLSANLYHLGDTESQIPDFSLLRPVETLRLKGLQMKQRTDFPAAATASPAFGIDASGSFWLAASGRYRFQLTSDDGSKLVIDQKLVINNDGEHAPTPEVATLNMKLGRHVMRVLYFENGEGGATLRMDMCRVRPE